MYRGRYTAIFLALLLATLHPSPADAKCVSVTVTSTGQTSTSCDGAPDSNTPTGTAPGDKTAPDAADAQCPAPDSTHKYDATKGKTWTEIRYDVKVTIQNLYGKECQDTEGKAVATNGICVAQKKCQAVTCAGGECKLPDGTKVPSTGGSSAPDPAKLSPSELSKNPSLTNTATNPLGTKVSDSIQQQIGKEVNSVISAAYSGQPISVPTGGYLSDLMSANPDFTFPGEAPTSFYDNLPQPGITNDFGPTSELDPSSSIGGGDFQQPPQTFAPSDQTTGFGAPPSSGTFDPVSQYTAEPGVPSIPSIPSTPASTPVSDPWTTEPAPSVPYAGLAPINAAYEPQSQFNTDANFYPSSSDWTKLGAIEYPFLSGDKIAAGQIGGQSGADIGTPTGGYDGQIRTPQDIATSINPIDFKAGQTIEGTVPAVGLNGGWATAGIGKDSLWYGNVSAINGNGTNIGYEWDPASAYVNFGTPSAGVLAAQEAERDANLAALQPQQTEVPDHPVVSIDPGQAPASTQTFTSDKTAWDTVKDYAGSAWDGAKYVAGEFLGVGSANAKDGNNTVTASTYGWDKGSGDSATQALAISTKDNPATLDQYPWSFAQKTGALGDDQKYLFTNPSTGDSVVLARLDRGPYVDGRDVDISRAAAEAIGMGQTVKGLQMQPVPADTPLGPYTKSEALPIQSLGSDASSPVAGDTRQDLAFGENPPLTTQPSQNKFAYEWQPDVSYSALGNTPKAVTSSDLPDITPIENRIPVASWIPDAQLSGEQLTAQINAAAEYDATKNITEYPTNDALSQDNQNYADEQAALQDRLAQADQQTAAYEQALRDAGNKIPVPDIEQQSGEQITAQINKEIDAQIPKPDLTLPTGEQITEDIQRSNEAYADSVLKNLPLPQDAGVQLPTQKEVWADLLAVNGKPFDASTNSIDEIYGAVGIPTGQQLSLDAPAGSLQGSFSLGDASVRADSNGLTFTDANGAETYIPKEQLGDQTVGQIIASAQADVATRPQVADEPVTPGADAKTPVQQSVPLAATESGPTPTQEQIQRALVDQSNQLNIANQKVVDKAWALQDAKNLPDGYTRDVQTDPTIPVAPITKADLVAQAQKEYDAATSERDKLAKNTFDISTGTMSPQLKAEVAKEEGTIPWLTRKYTEIQSSVYNYKLFSLPAGNDGEKYDVTVGTLLPIGKLSSDIASDAVQRARTIGQDFNAWNLTPSENLANFNNPRTGWDTAGNAAMLYLDVGAPGAGSLLGRVAAPIAEGFGFGTKATGLTSTGLVADVTTGSAASLDSLIQARNLAVTQLGDGVANGSVAITRVPAELNMIGAYDTQIARLGGTVTAAPTEAELLAMQGVAKTDAPAAAQSVNIGSAAAQADVGGQLNALDSYAGQLQKSGIAAQTEAQAAKVAAQLPQVVNEASVLPKVVNSDVALQPEGFYDGRLHLNISAPARVADEGIVAAAEGEGVTAGESVGASVTEGKPSNITVPANDNVPTSPVAIAPDEVRVPIQTQSITEQVADTWTNFKNSVSEFFSPSPVPYIEPTVPVNPSNVRVVEPVQYPAYVPEQISGTAPAKLAEPSVAPVVSGPTGEIPTGSQINHATNIQPSAPTPATTFTAADEKELQSLLSKLAQQNQTPLQKTLGDLGDVRPGAQGSLTGSPAGDLSKLNVNQPISATNQAPSLDAAVAAQKNPLNTFTQQGSQFDALTGKTIQATADQTQGLGSLRDVTLNDSSITQSAPKTIAVDLPESASVNAKISLGELPEDGVRVSLTDTNNRVVLNGSAQERAALVQDADSSGRTVQVVVSREDLAKLQSGSGDVTIYPAPKAPYASAVDAGTAAPLQNAATPSFFSGVKNSVAKVWDTLFGGKSADVAELSPAVEAAAPRTTSPEIARSQLETLMGRPLTELEASELGYAKTGSQAPDLARSQLETLMGRPLTDAEALQLGYTDTKAATAVKAAIVTTGTGLGVIGAANFPGSWDPSRSTAAQPTGPQAERTLANGQTDERFQSPTASKPEIQPAAKTPVTPKQQPTQTQQPVQTQTPHIENPNSGFGGILNTIASAVGGFLGNLLKGQGNAQNQNAQPATTPTPTTPSTPTTPIANPTAQVSLVANPSSITAGQKATLSWAYTGTAQCGVVDGAGNAMGSSSPLTVSPQTTTTYKVTCGSATPSSATVTVR